MKRAIKILFLLIISVLFSCEKFNDFPGCSKCKAEEPTRAQLRFNFESSWGVPMYLKVYEGDLSDSILIATHIYSTYLPFEYKINVALNKKYSATGTYEINKQKYIVVGATKIGVVYEKERCDDPCYYVYNDIIDLRLKKTY
jgi:hypothetical protein